MPSDHGGTVAGVVLAAGMSSRMGRNKLLLDVGGEPVVRRTVQHVVDAGLSPVIVVTGYEADRVRVALDGLPYREAYNEEYAKGINGSVRRGISSVPNTSVAAVIILADMPLVTPRMIAELVTCYRTTEAPVAISEYGEVRAPPTLYDRSVFAEFRETEGDGCGRRIVQRYRDRAVSIQLPKDALVDLDVVDDHDRIKAYFAKEPS